MNSAFSFDMNHYGLAQLEYSYYFCPQNIYNLGKTEEYEEK